MSRRCLCALLIHALLLPLIAIAPAGAEEGSGPRSIYLLQSSVVGAAGAPAAGPEHSLVGTLGQPTPIGIASGEEFTLYAGFWMRLLTLLADVEPFAPEPLRTMLFQTYPNPARGSTAIRFSIASAGPVELAVFDVNGRRVRTLADRYALPGPYAVVWDERDDLGARVPSGVYFYRLNAGSYNSIKRMLIVR